jgi:hypothetical protein
MVANLRSVKLDRLEVKTLVPAWFLRVVIGKSFNGWAGLCPPDIVGHADDGTGIETAAQLGKNWPIGPDALSDRMAKQIQEMFLVIPILGVTNLAVRIECPVSGQFIFSAVLEAMEVRWLDDLDLPVRGSSQGRIRI